MVRTLRRWYWQYRGRECCERCGRQIVVAWWAPHDVWREVVEALTATLCIDCFAGLAHRRGVLIVFEANCSSVPGASAA